MSKSKNGMVTMVIGHFCITSLSLDVSESHSGKTPLIVVVPQKLWSAPYCQHVSNKFPSLQEANFAHLPFFYIYFSNVVGNQTDRN